MYTLRRITKTGVQMNRSLGSSYTLIDREISYDDFCRAFKLIFGVEHVADLDPASTEDSKNVYCFVSNENGEVVQPLFKNQRNYIMTESGSTFSNLSFK